jgi:hypothetical protein
MKSLITKASIFREKIILRSTEQTDILMFFVEIPSVSRNRKRAEFPSDLFEE